MAIMQETPAPIRCVKHDELTEAVGYCPLCLLRHMDEALCSH